MIRLYIPLIIAVFSSCALCSAASPRSISIGSGSFGISFDGDADGAWISSITVSGEEALNTAGSSEIFILDLSSPGGGELRLRASEGWGNVTTTSTESQCRIEFSDPGDAEAPAGLLVVMTLEVEGSHSHRLLYSRPVFRRLIFSPGLMIISCFPAIPESSFRVRNLRGWTGVRSIRPAGMPRCSFLRITDPLSGFISAFTIRRHRSRPSMQQPLPAAS